MGIVISLILVAFGAILTWAVNTEGGSVDPQVVGVILMIVGIVVFLISLVLWRTWWGAGFWAGPATTARPGRLVRRRVYRPAVRRTTYVEEEPPPPPGHRLPRRLEHEEGVHSGRQAAGQARGVPRHRHGRTGRADRAVEGRRGGRRQAELSRWKRARSRASTTSTRPTCSRSTAPSRRRARTTTTRS